MSKRTLFEQKISSGDRNGFWKLKSAKVDWDLVLARCFLDNIVVKRKAAGILVGTHSGARQDIPSTKSGHAPPQRPIDDSEYVLLPRNQTRQLSGLVAFASALRWPEIERVVEGLSNRLGIVDSLAQSLGQLMSTNERFVELSISPFTSVYGTPLPKPSSTSNISGIYFHRNDPDSAVETPALNDPLEQLHESK
ncbi:uncharacterized protein EI97DRAFT_457580 [Westerdykella ornata]|uniref:Uncharacterized protein n=1 Tax=Westerdykella ornata TaxID=318751 RepID=A0A6A6JLV9_WESOR|nr:uncharacterized protein EI97DRAFT_457580 [Westerdykella ornata]KAF2277581.1 hypothetical protein EI97DRAFT_457580 [Westerdykella ornata]